MRQWCGPLLRDRFFGSGIDLSDGKPNPVSATTEADANLLFGMRNADYLPYFDLVAVEEDLHGITAVDDEAM